MHKIEENQHLYINPLDQWDFPVSSDQAREMMTALESGQVIYFPNLSFAIESDEQPLLSFPLNPKRSKNVSYNSRNQMLGGIDLRENKALLQPLMTVMKRYHQMSTQLLNACCPGYQADQCNGRTSFRPIEIKGRKPPSYRKDDTRLHVDAFPSTPVNQTRILRVFTNINPYNEPRAWRLGESFSTVIQRFLPKVRPMLPFESDILYRLKITRKKRSHYDHCMLQIHNRMKAEMDYQQQVAAVSVDFPPGSTWIVYTDLVSHAALAGRYLLEQTFYPSVANMLYPMLSPQQQICHYR